MGTFDVIAGGHGDPRGRDEREFTRLYRESYGLVYSFVRYRMASDEADKVKGMNSGAIAAEPHLRHLKDLVVVHRDEMVVF